MSMRRLDIIVGATGITLALLLFAAWFIAPFIGNPCGKLPIAEHVNLPLDPSIHIISPSTGSNIRTDSFLVLEAEISNFWMDTSNYNVHVWVDGNSVDSLAHKNAQSTDVILSKFPKSVLNDGIHDICLALVDGKTGVEIGYRAGVRVNLSFRAPDAVDFFWLFPFCFLSFIAIIAIFLGVTYRKW